MSLSFIIFFYQVIRVGGVYRAWVLIFFQVIRMGDTLRGRALYCLIPFLEGVVSQFGISATKILGFSQIHI